MKFIPTKLHGILDYIYGIVVMASPWLFGFAQGGPETWVPVVVGVITLLQSIMTNYELGLMRILPMPAHIIGDIIVGLFLALSPQIFNFWDQVWWPHVFFGVFAVATAAFTKTVPADKQLT